LLLRAWLSVPEAQLFYHMCLPCQARRGRGDLANDSMMLGF